MFASGRRSHVARTRGAMNFVLLVACSLLAAALGSAGCGKNSRLQKTQAAPHQPGVVLYETHTQSGQFSADTLVTYVTAQAVRVSHATGDAILDFGANRIVLLDRDSKTYRSEALETWEARIAEAFEALRDSSAAAAPQFEPAGTTAEIAGYACERFVLYTRRDLLGARETVEQQVWVTNELELPAGAFEAYQRALGTVESVGMAAATQYPAGIILRRETRTRPADAARRVHAHVEIVSVFRVEAKDISSARFMVPPEYTKNDASPR